MSSQENGNFDDLEAAAQQNDRRLIFERLFARLEAAGEYQQLFEALVLDRRCELGLPPIQVGSTADIPEPLVPAMEEGIAAACRRVGRLFLESGDPARAWPYLRAVGDTASMKAAIDAIEPGTRRKDLESLIEIAIHENVHPARGFELAIRQFGLCNSITRFEQMQAALRGNDIEESARVLVRCLYRELLENIRHEVRRRDESAAVEGLGLLALIEKRPDLFAGDAYYIDSSHLYAVIRFSAHIPGGQELDQAIELVEYGRRLSKLYQYQTEPPFENYYEDQGIFLRGMRAAGAVSRAPGESAPAGGAPAAEADAEAVEMAAGRFASKIRAILSKETPPDRRAGYPIQTALMVLARLGRAAQALDLALEYEALEGPGRCRSPSVYELCQMAGDFDRLARIARSRNDPVVFTAALVRKGSPPAV